MTETPEMTCRELVELVTDYLEGALDDPELARLEAHLAGCDDCTAYLQQMRRTISVTGSLTEASVPTEGRDELLGAFRAWRSSGT